jgi:hypothetical protein
MMMSEHKTLILIERNGRTLVITVDKDLDVDDWKKMEWIKDFDIYENPKE